ncbi:unnamed protein product [Rotaria sp. Silwood1]|nr:unnamed protein product [Rotaria sp. Silwood1]
MTGLENWEDYIFLRNTQCESYKKNIFQTDIPTDLLHELPLLYQLNSSYNDAEVIIDILLNLTKSKRFELIKSFLTDKDKFELDLLFSRLCSFVNLRFSIFLLRNVYFS